VFKAFSNYFPITLRESTTPIGITPEDLKVALRKCFSAHHRLARLAFPYLIQRLDQGDSMKVTVKVRNQTGSYPEKVLTVTE
jgi:DNA repair/transcription protein MET18/MMS19